MRFGVMLPHGNAVASPAAIVEVAHAAEALGYDSVVVRAEYTGDGFCARGTPVMVVLRAN